MSALATIALGLHALFPATTQEVHERATKLKVESSAAFDEILAVPDGARTFANTIQAYDDLCRLCSTVENPIGLLKKVAPGADMRHACEEAQRDLAAFSVDTFTRPEIYHAFEAYQSGAMRSDELSIEQAHFVVSVIDNFKKSGFALPEAELEQVKALSKQLADLSISYYSNIAEDDRRLEVPKAQLVGVNTAWLEAQEVDESGNCLLRGNSSSYGAVMWHCNDASVRAQMYRFYYNRAYPSNISVLEQVAQKRHELARLLGYMSAAERDLSGTMIGTPERAHDFIAQLQEQLRPHVRAELSQLCGDLPASVELDEHGKLHPWDVSYAQDHYNRNHYDYNAGEISSYFPTESTLKGLLLVYEDFFDVRFESAETSGFWSDDIELIAVHDKSSDKLLGHIFMDLYTRPGKYTHVCHEGIISGLSSNDEPTVGCVIANFSKPTESKPAFLSQWNVRMFFHEFGHALHHLFGRTQMHCFTGTKTTRDFVEAPSQMFELWLEDREILKRISCHYKTLEPLPDELLGKILAKPTSAHYYNGQCNYALYSLNCYGQHSPDVLGLWQSIWGNNPHVGCDESSHEQATFGHLMGYGAGYYGYLWSNVIAHDCFTKVKEGGLLNPEMGRELRDKVLSKGGSVDPNTLVESFLGREVHQDAFLEGLGLA